MQGIYVIINPKTSVRGDIVKNPNNKRTTKTDDKPKYPNKIYALRNDHEPKITQQELAEAAGVSQVMISKYEEGNTMPNAMILHYIAEYLGTTFMELYEKTIEAQEKERNTNSREKLH